jgi:hypothetical protein
MFYAYWQIGHIVQNYLQGRELVVYGTGRLAFDLWFEINEAYPISFFISKNAENYSHFFGKPVKTIKNYFCSIRFKI